MSDYLRLTSPLIPQLGDNFNKLSFSNNTRHFDEIITSFDTEIRHLTEHEREILSTGGEIPGVYDNDGVSRVLVLAQMGQVNILSTYSKETLSKKDENNVNALHVACTSKQTHAIHLLCDRGIDVDAKDNTGTTSLMRSAYENDIKAVVILLENGVDVNATDRHGRSALMAAVQQGHADMATKLIENGADIRQMTNAGQTALFYAWMRDRKGMAELLIQKDIRLLIHQDIDGNTVYHKCAANGNIEMLTFLLKLRGNKPEVIDFENKAGRTPLIEAVLYNRHGIAKLLVEHGASKSLVTSTGICPTSIVSVNGNKNMKSIFIKDLEKKATTPKIIFAAIECRNILAVVLAQKELHEINPAGFTPLMFACAKGDIGIIQTIIQLDSSLVNAVGIDGVTAISCALGYGNMHVAEFLTAYGADINRKDSTGQTLLHKCAAKGDLKGITTLIGFGANPKVTDRDGNTPLMLTSINSPEREYLRNVGEGVGEAQVKVDVLFEGCRTGNIGIVKTSLKNCTRMEIADRDGNLPLCTAARNGHLNIVKFLLWEKSANPNAVDMDGKSALMHASEMGQFDVVLVLVDHNAVINILTRNNETALNYAIRGNHEAIVMFLIANNGSVGLVNQENRYHACDDVSVIYAAEFARLSGHPDLERCLQKLIRVPTKLEETMTEDNTSIADTHQLPNGAISDIQIACLMNVCREVETVLSERTWSRDDIFEMVNFFASRNQQLVLCTFQDNGVNIIKTLLQKQNGMHTLMELSESFGEKPFYLKQMTTGDKEKLQTYMDQHTRGHREGNHEAGIPDLPTTYLPLDSIEVFVQEMSEENVVGVLVYDRTEQVLFQQSMMGGEISTI